MRLARHGDNGSEQPIIGDTEGAWFDLTSLTEDITPRFLATGLDSARAALESGSLAAVADVRRFGPPLSGIGKIVCVGLNYRAHATETGAIPPTEPILFMKAPDTVVGANDTVFVPRGSKKTDWEVELAVVIGSEAAYLSDPADASSVIAGYAVSNDVSEREFQSERGGQWDKGKNCATFNPFGPWIRTADDVADPQGLALRTWVNGDLRQDGNTSDMIFSVYELVHYVSQFMTLYPGDVINTGTPAGVALGSNGKFPFLAAGDVVELEVEGLGRQKQTFAQA